GVLALGEHFGDRSDVQRRMERRPRRARAAVRRPRAHVVRVVAEVCARIDVVVPGGHHVLVVALVRQCARDVLGHRGAAVHGQCAAFAEVVLYVNDDQRRTHRPPPFRGSTTVGMAGSPWDNVRPSHGRLTSARRRCCLLSASVGRSGAGSPPRISGIGRVRSWAPGSGGSCAGWTTSSIAVPVSLCLRSADLRPPCDSLFKLRLATGSPSTSTSLYTMCAVGAPDPVTTDVPTP